MPNTLTTLTERGQVSMPADIRRKLGIRAGEPLLWRLISDTECRVVLVRKLADRRSKRMRGFMKRFQKGDPSTTSGWMKLLREGEQQ
jgi:AbrB family looped-hinge helix DNA binding protein